jgi:ketosteroid isomerase-like protein
VAGTREVIDRYYELANAGRWDEWCDLFGENQVMDEQLAGHVEGLATLREMMKGMDAAYARFQNVPRHIIVDGEQAAVFSHISGVATRAPDRPIEAEVANYFLVRDGRIVYLANVHDTRPFDPFTGRGEEGR